MEILREMYDQFLFDKKKKKKSEIVIITTYDL